MRKFFAFVLGIAMMLSLAACGGKAGAGRGESSPGSAAASGQTTGPAGQNGTEFQATIEETVLVDERDVKITATELRAANYAVELVLQLENNSGRDLKFHSGTLRYNRNSVNGYMMDGLYVGADVPAGKKATETVSIDKDDLLFHGITDIADIEMAFTISDSDYNDYLQTEPVQLKTSLGDSYDYAADPYQAAMSGGDIVAALGGTQDYFAVDELYNEQGVRIVSEMFVKDRNGEPAVFVELENTSDRMATVRIKDICLNGLQLQSGSWSSDAINAGKRRVAALRPGSLLDLAYWEPYGLGALEEISFTLGLEDADGNALCDDAPITIAVPDADAAYRSDGETVYSGDGVRILNMGIVPDSFDLSDDIHLLLLAENGSKKAVRVDVGYDTLSVNGYMADFYCYGMMLAPGKSGVLDVQLEGGSLAENGITEIEDIKNIELTFDIDDDRYHEIASPTVTIAAGDQPAEDPAAATEPPAGAAPGGEDGGAAAPGVSPDFKALMDSYEAFFNEYAAFMEKYQSANNSADMMMDYLSFLGRYAETMEKLNEIDTDSLSAADLAYYTQVMARISADLMGAAG